MRTDFYVILIMILTVAVCITGCDEDTKTVVVTDN